MLQALPMTSICSQETAARENTKPLGARLAAALVLGMFSVASIAAQSTPQAPSSPPDASQTPVTALTCTSKPGERAQCPADTSKGVVLLRSMGDAPCLLGKTWGYDQTSVWVAEGCDGVFALGETAPAQTTIPTAAPRSPAERIETWGEFDPGAGFLIGRSRAGELSISGYALVRYVNQMPDEHDIHRSPR